MADTKNQDNNQDKKDDTNATGELNWSGSQHGHGVKVEVKDKAQETSSMQEAPRETSPETTKEAPDAPSETPEAATAHKVSMNDTEEAGTDAGAKRQATAFIVGIIVGALLTSIFI